MKQRYLEGEALLAACRAGSGVIVMVEGETAQDDAYFYQQWFGGQAREITFLPQNGWRRVEAAVRELRAALPHRAIFGLVDRDFTPRDIIDSQHAQCPSDGIYRLPFYTLENALLEPEGWLAVARLFSRAPLHGWETLEAIDDRIGEAYSACLPLAAYNRVVHDESHRLESGERRRYLKDPRRVQRALPNLDEWGRRRGAPDDLSGRYDHHLAALGDLRRVEWATHVTGKAVVSVLCDRFNASLTRGVPHEHLINAYLREHPEPPAALTRIVEAILTAAKTA